MLGCRSYTVGVRVLWWRCRGIGVGVGVGVLEKVYMEVLGCIWRCKGIGVGVRLDVLGY